MKLGPFANCIAEIFERPPAGVSAYAQYLRANGLISSLGRGAGAEMGPSDGTNLLLTFLADLPVRAAPEIVGDMRKFKLLEAYHGRSREDGSRTFDEVSADKLPFEFACNTLGEAIDGVIAALMFNGEIVSKHEPGAVQKEFGGLQYFPNIENFTLWLVFSPTWDVTLCFGPKPHAQSAKRQQSPAIEITKRLRLAVLERIAAVISIPSSDSKIALVAKSQPAESPPPKRKPRGKKVEGKAHG